MSDTITRGRYQPSGQAGGARLALRAGLLPVAGLTMAYVLYLAYLFSWDVLVVIPVLVGFPVAGALFWAIHQGHCRSPRVGAILGLAAGVFFYLSFYYIDFLHQAGLGQAHRLDRLPRHIQRQLATNTFELLGKLPIVRPGPPVPPGGGLPEPSLLRLLLFTAELGVLGLIGACLGWTWPKRPYCEQTGRWMIEETASYVAGTGRALVEALRQGGPPAEWAWQPPPRSGGGPPKDKLTVHYSPPTEAGLSPVYLTVAEVVGQHHPSLLLEEVELSPREAATLSGMFPCLATAVRPAPVQPPADSAPEPSSGVEMQPIPAPFANRALGLTTMVVVNVGNLLTAFGGLVLLVAAALALGTRAFLGPVVAVVLAAVLGVLGLVLTGVVLVMSRRRVAFGTAYMHWVVRRSVRQRPDPVVEADDPEALYVEVIPRQNWGRVMLETATDVGLLLVDARQRIIRFEGDRERYRIAAEAVMDCQVEAMGDGAGNHEPFYLAVLQVDRGNTVVEVPLLPRRAGSGVKLPTGLWERAEWLRQRIGVILRAEQAVPVSPGGPGCNHGDSSLLTEPRRG